MKNAALIAILGASLATAASGCGSDTRPGTDECDPACGAGEVCMGGVCQVDGCLPGDREACYTGPVGTEGVGACTPGMRTCTGGGTWGICVGEVTPSMETCGNGIDENCSGQADEDADLDGDGYSTCDGDCCDSTECGQPALVNPGAFEDPTNMVDDDCDQIRDNALISCDAGLLSNSGEPLDYARALDLCQFTDEASLRWGVLSATLSLPDGGAIPPAANSRAIRDGFGTNNAPRLGSSLVVLSTGHAADASDANPPFAAFDFGQDMRTTSALPADYMSANAGVLPNAPGCPPPTSTTANDAVMLTLRIRVPSNARSFSLSSSFLSAEYPEYTCTQYNDFFVILLDSTYAATPPNPTDKNLAFYEPPGMVGTRYPVGVNLAAGNTGLFRQCVNGPAGCNGDVTFQHTVCEGTTELAGTGMDRSDFGCSTFGGQMVGGGTGWLVTAGNVVPGEIITLRIAIWDTSDHVLDSVALIDNFKWSVEAADPGTVID
ncbi:MAG: choice-of-anchor L domain-containing protein [Kofleriaceae bacterium]|nr:choice-of-anchor L domain-containing protein [Kofleriaceae bacterium]